ncbi:transporter [Clostridium botulinum B2 128]|uniref:CynX/NimT family MFS transporter n=1 Tax=Clostridium botulinum TaxID=1491 RepID=UPI0007DFD42D|nr:MFS transporter [Clostridium botulinum]KEI76223.1 transporter [Clostridium botulinum B2 128]NFI41366.1 MFS transporter [Clostridium botulinum]NFI75914.1 MFS transporter [Clostridium botulinum]NFJ36199.1 MFS transporter [Clostridium botulinum]NFS21119.1 MFS transporter [Clostridium botulinum]
MMSLNKSDKKQNNMDFKVRKSASLMLIIGIIFIAANLRAPLTSVGPLVKFIKDNLHISNTLAGMITTLPLFAFALFSPVAPRLGRKFGVELVLLLSVIFLTVGIILRSLSGVAGLFIGTAIIGLAISVANVLIPSLIKRDFPEKIGVMTGVYSISMNTFGAIASGISVPIATRLGLKWSGALGIWGILSFISIILWLPQVKRNDEEASKGHKADSSNVSLWKSSLAWQVTLFMGLQSLVFYSMVAWMPEILMQKGMSSNKAGWMLSLMQLALIPFTFIVSVLAGRRSNQRSLVISGCLFILIGILGLLYGSSQFVFLWIIILGIGGGFAFSLSMMFFSLRTENSNEAAQLSGMAQSLGYLLAAFGPILFGFLHDATNSWKVPLQTLIGITVLLFIFGLGASRNRYVGSSLKVVR